MHRRLADSNTATVSHAIHKITRAWHGQACGLTFVTDDVAEVLKLVVH